MKISNVFISIFFTVIILLAACSKQNSGDGTTNMVSDHTKKYLGNYYFTTVTTTDQKGILVSDTTYYNGIVSKYPSYFAFVDINYAQDQTIWTELDTNGSLIIFANGPLSQLWSGQFINENEVNIVYDSLPFFSKNIHGIRE